MFTIVWTVTVCVCGFAIVLLDQAPLLLSLLGLVLLYGAAIAYDVHRVVAWRPKRNGIAQIDFFTSYGDELLKLRGNLQYQHEAQVKEVKRKSFLSSIKSEQKYDEVSLVSLLRGPAPSSESNLFETILKFLQDRLKANGIAIVVPLSKEGGRKIYQVNLSGKKIESQLVHLFDWYFRDDQFDAAQGIVDERQEENALGSFSPVGVNYSLRLPLRLRDSQDSRTCLVFFAYQGQVEPSESELAAARSLVAKIAREYEAGSAITELESRAHELEGSNRAKSDFISHMSHDIRSPLNNIRSILSLFKHEGVSQEHEDMLDVAFANCESLSEIVEAILDYSKFSAGKLTAKPEVFDLRALTQTVLESFAVTARLKGLELRIRSNAQASAFVNADKKQLRRVLGNLVSNAIKYTNAGFVEVGLRSVDEVSWQIDIRDTGVGMSPEQLESLFSPFTRFECEQTEGIGLGLALTKILLQVNNGSVKVSSNPGKGSVFSITIPRHIAVQQQESDVKIFPDTLPAAEDIISERVDVLGRTQETSSGLRILLVDDDADCVDTLARSLEMAGHQVFKSISVANAISIYNFEIPDVVITDISMPDGGGQRVIDYISKLPHDSKLFVVSGSTSVECGEGIKDRVDRIFEKPLDIDELLIELDRSKGSESKLVA